MAESFHTPAQVGRLLGVDPKTVTRWARAGQLPCVVLPSGHRRFRDSDIQRILAGRRGDERVFAKP